MLTGIYILKNKLNNKVYIGQSTDIKRRLLAHKNGPFNPKNNCYTLPIYKAIRYYGLKNFQFKILELCKKNDLNDKEKFWISFYKSNDYMYGYNLTGGGFDSSENIYKISQNDLDNVIKLLLENKSNIEIAKLYNVSDQLISDINNGRARKKDNLIYPIRRRLKMKKEKVVLDKKIFKRPDKMDLAKLIKENGFKGVAKMIGCTDKTIAKWCIDYNIPHKKQELISWYNKENKIQDIKINKEKLFRHNSKSEPMVMYIEGGVINFENVDSCVNFLIKKGYSKSNTKLTKKGLMRCLLGKRKTYLDFSFKYSN
jgi:group I intron endonuclease